MARRARVRDIHRLAQAMPHVTVYDEKPRPVYQVGGKSFVYFRNPRADAVDEHGDKLPDVVCIWVRSEQDKLALLQDESLPFFSTPHFDGHPSVLLREADVGQLDVDELAEIIQDAWLAQASHRRAQRWLTEHGLDDAPP